MKDENFNAEDDGDDDEDAEEMFIKIGLSHSNNLITMAIICKRTASFIPLSLPLFSFISFPRPGSLFPFNWPFRSLNAID